MSYENKILQLKKMLGGKKEKVEQKTFFQKPPKPDHLTSWKNCGLTAIENDFGVVLKREIEYPLEYQHGSYMLGAFYDAIEKWENSSLDHPFSLTFDEDILFFDTETTGLKGVGTQIFLVGLLEGNDNGFLLTQYVLADPSNEAALLFESKFWQKPKTIVTNNGKSFDWPQLESRWALHQRFLPKLREHRQVDLFHSSKRIWKKNLEKMKLTTVEEEKLGFKRKGDIPGFLAPIIYADALKSGNADTLMKVLYHNEWDLLSLITLYIHSTNLLFDTTMGEAATTLTNVGKWYGDLKFGDESERFLRKVTDDYGDKESCLAYFYLAMDQKRKGQFEEAATYFEKAIINLEDRKLLKAYEQLAILYEHQFKSFDIALNYSLKGISLISNSIIYNTNQKMNLLERWEKRVQRIENKRNIS